MNKTITRPALLAEEAMQMIDERVKEIICDHTLSYTALIGALHELTQRYEYERRCLWINQQEKEQKS